MDFMLSRKAVYDAVNVSSYKVLKIIVENPLPQIDKYIRYRWVIRTATAIKPAERFQSYEEFTKQLTEAKNKPKQAEEKTIEARKIKNDREKKLKHVSKEKNNKHLVYIAAIIFVLFVLKLWHTSNVEKPERDVVSSTDTVAGEVNEDPMQNTSKSKKTKNGYPKTEKGVTWTDKENGIYTDKRDGKKYKVAKIGSQIWMAENLNYTKEIPKITEKQQWVNLKDNRYDAAWCYYDNKTKNGKRYGALYTYAAALKVAPQGWHLPTKEEYEVLFNYYGGEGKQVYKTIIKEGNSNFAVVFGGWRGSYGNFSYKDYYTGFWSATEDGNTFAWNCYFESDLESTRMFSNPKSIGLSVRLIRD